LQIGLAFPQKKLNNGVLREWGGRSISVIKHNGNFHQ
jgi:hypothetical protein